MTAFKRYLVTSALPYTNGPVHIGQLAGAYVPADIYVRYLRMKYGDENVVYVCGSDEHGVPITLRAKREGISPQAVVDKYHEIIKKSFEEFGIKFDIYHRTSDRLHHETASDFFTKLYEDGVFLEQESEQYFDEEAQQFLADRYITGECPKCGNPEAYGDQCEKCGSSLSPMDLINPKSTLSGSPLIRKSTKHWYLPLDKIQEDWLEDWIVNAEGRDEKWKKNVLGQCKSWLDQGLQPRAVTRDLNWGVQVPLKDAADKVLYVWFDAPIGYISATKAWAAEKGQDWKDYWQNEDCKLVHFIGKDNIVFHCIIFPAMLKAHGSYTLPTNVPANEFMNMEGDKMSTSRNWTVWLHEYLEEFPNQQDVLRYNLIANMPENKDSEFTWKDFQTRNNTELVGNLGNFVNRVLVLTHKYFEGKVQAAGNHGLDQELLQAIGDTYGKVAGKLERYEFKQGIQEVLQLSSAGNKFLADTEPWKLIKEDPKRTGEILYTATQVVAHLSVLLKPFLPFTADKIAAMLGLSDSDRQWKDGYSDLVNANDQLGKAQLLFAKIDDSTIEKQLQKLAETKQSNEAANIKLPESKETIQYDDFVKMDIRIGTILTAEKVKKANKLLQITVDLGIDQRTIVSGIAEHFSPEEIIGQQVCVLANLAPRKLRGVESQGMILMAEERDGSLKFVQPKDDAENGITVM